MIRRIALLSLFIAFGLASDALAGDRCRKTKECTEVGNCTWVKGTCAPGGPRDCEQSDDCQKGESPMCLYDQTVGCELEECGSSPVCRMYGLCHENEETGGICHSSAKSCKKSIVCKAYGWCAAVEGSYDGCVATKSAHCAASLGCKREGGCGLEKGLCVAQTEAHCRKSSACSERGLCNAKGGQCVATAAGCKASKVCSWFGACTPQDDRCAVVTTADCKAAKVCTSHGLCSASAGRCTKTTAAACSRLAPVKVASATTSSTHKRYKHYVFEVKGLIDGSLDTSWQPRRNRRGGAGQWFELKLDRPRRISAIEIANGFQRRDMLGDLFLFNNRIQHALVTFSDGSKEAVAFTATERGMRRLSFTPRLVSSLRVEVVEVHRGLRWNDLAVSEVRVLGCND